MKTTTYTCDICKKTKDEKSLASVDILARGMTDPVSEYMPEIHFDVCKECLQIQEVEYTQLKDKFNKVLTDLGIVSCK